MEKETVNCDLILATFEFIMKNATLGVQVVRKKFSRNHLKFPN